MFSYCALKVYVHCPGQFTIGQTTALAVVCKVQYHEHVFTYLKFIGPCIILIVE